jgi:hypothetical protein
MVRVKHFKPCIYLVGLVNRELRQAPDKSGIPPKFNFIHTISFEVKLGNFGAV